MNKQIEELARELNTAIFGVNAHILADHLKPETINKVAEYLYDTGHRKQEWISVEERLPEHEENVLVAVDYEHIRAAGVYISSLLERRQGERWTHKGYTVTHWMPLPEAPKMKGGVQE